MRSKKNAARTGPAFFFKSLSPKYAVLIKALFAWPSHCATAALPFSLPQLTDHTGEVWVTAFQEQGLEIMGRSGEAGDQGA